METGALVTTCIEAIRSFREARMSLEVHMQEYLDTNKIRDEDDITFIEQVLLGWYRFRKLLQSTVEEFYATHSEAQSNDSILYQILAYLAIFRLEELGFSAFKTLVASQSVLKMSAFFGWLFDSSIIESSLKMRWEQLYDVDFVKNSLIQPLLDMATGTQSFSGDGMEESDASQSRASLKQVTIPEPFQLTKPKPRLVPEPEPIGEKFKPNRIPKSTYTTDEKTKEAIEAFREGRKLSTAKGEAQRDSNLQPRPFRLRTLERPSNIDQVRQEVERKKKEDIESTRFKVRRKNPDEVKGYLEKCSNTAVKLNAAAILREDAVYKKKQALEAETLKAYEEELRDASSFAEWQEEMKLRDALEREAAIRRRKLEMQLSEEEAREARLRAEEYNRKVAEEEKKRLESLLHEKAMLEEEERLQKKIQAEELNQEIKSKVCEAKQRVRNSKKEAALEIRKELEEMEMLIAKRIEEERLRKEDLIRQIRALEKVPNAKLPVFDPTESSGLGLLNEMSLTELRERLALLKEEERRKEEEKRKEILSAKQERERLLQSKLDNIEKFRKAARADAKSRRETLQGEEKKAKNESQIADELRILELEEKLRKKKNDRKERNKLIREEEQQKRLQQQFLRANAAAREERHWDAQEKGMRRELRERQNLLLDERAEQTEVAQKERSVKKKTARLSEAEQTLRDHAHEALIEEAKLQTLAKEVDLAARKREMAAERRRHVETLRASRMADKPFLYEGTHTSKAPVDPSEKNNLTSRTELDLPPSQY